ncbi:asparaginase [Uliginosibacterium sp. H3]|uniref:Asparaginase n=1 Tax=Uliginosibacterium silvisoli TaxID=3114758 RepID=A0ABU6K6F9_9RHOO|nr:asparaginase [Uliginosibacterium sp. H3]
MKRILLLYTGGTIGCEGQPLAPMTAERFSSTLAGQGLLPGGCELRALPQPLDSADMQPTDWLDIASALLAAWSDFDGFVVLHGTDTLAFSAAALSYLLPGLDKPVVLTGSQHPLLAAMSDAPRNLADAIAVASTPGLYEVCVCFAGQILRGNRCVKRSAAELDAFASPNWPLLGAVSEGGVVLNAQALLAAHSAPFDAEDAGAGFVAMREAMAPVWGVHLHPGFPSGLMNAALALPDAPSGWVLACYGSGNAPQQPDFLAALQAAHAQGVVLVAVTQTGHGSVSLSSYVTGAGLSAAGVVAGRDMTLPAALVKLQLLLARGFSPAETAARMLEPVAGELSPV